MKKTQTKTKIVPEGEHMEWKQSLGEWKEIVETCAAFATAGGGTVRVGISPDGTRVGVQIGKGTLEDLANKIAQNTNPRLTPSVSTSVDDGKSVVEVAVSASPFKPVYAFDRAMSFVKRNIRMGVAIRDVKREDVWEYPLVEQFGTGIQRILDDCREHGTPQPEFEVHGQTFRAVFRPGISTETTHADAILSEREEAIIALLKKQGKITRNDIESILGLPGRTASRYLKVLETKGVVVRRGTGRNSWYALASSA